MSQEKEASRQAPWWGGETTLCSVPTDTQRPWPSCAPRDFTQNHTPAPESILNCEAVHLHSQFLTFSLISYAIGFIGLNSYVYITRTLKWETSETLVIPISHPARYPGPTTAAGHQTQGRETDVFLQRPNYHDALCSHSEGATVSTK